MARFETNVFLLNSLRIASLRLELYYSELGAKGDKLPLVVTNGFHGAIELYSGFSYMCTG